MASTIKGITVALGGDTTELNESIDKIEKTTKNTQKELNTVNKLLKFDPSNTVLLTQKQELLAEQIRNAGQKLSQLESIQGDVEQAFKKGDLGAEQYRAFQREVESCKSHMGNMGKQADETKTKLSNTGDEAGDTAEELKDMGKQAEKSESNFDGLKDSAKSLASNGLEVVKAGAVAVAAGIAATGAAAISLGKEVTSAYADYEQLVGGVDTLFKDSSGKIQEYADNAYKTAGLNANEYMETVTGFSASLISSLGGDTEKAADYADMAITDMSDNANKMGTDISSIQNAYQGFAKQNYTMLDNLKLGYGGTKSEMERLLSDATAISGIEYNIDSYADVVSAIHTIQDSMDITGTTAKEAEHTISGSISSMHSAINNLTVGLGNADSDVEMLCENVIDSFINVVTNIEPVIGNVVDSLPKITDSIIGAVDKILPELLPMVIDIFSQVTKTLATLSPKLIKVAIELMNTFIDCFLDPEILESILDVAVDILTAIVNGFTTALPEFISALLEILPTVLQSIIEALITAIPQIITAVVDIITAIADTIPTIVPILVAALPMLINSIVNGLLDALPQLINAGIQLFLGLIEALPEIITAIVKALPEITQNIIYGLLEALPLLIQAGIQLFTALIAELPVIILSIVEALPEIIDGIIDGLLDALPQLIKAGVQLFIAIIKDTPKIIKGIIEHIPEIVTGIINGFSSLFDKMCEIGGNIISGLWQGICDGAEWLWDCIEGFCNDLWGNITGFFGIHSPSRLFRDELGKNLMLGWSIGIDDNSEDVMKSIADVSSGITEISQNSVLALQDNLSSLDGFNANINVLEQENRNLPPLSNESIVNNSPVITLNFGGVTLSSGYDTERFADDIMTALGSKIVMKGMEWG